jgi:putative thiamine transport system permease protein
VPVKTLGWLVPGCGLFCTLVLILLARGSDTAFTPYATSFSLGMASSLLALIILVLWLEWGPQRGAFWIWPLALPALPLVFGQYVVALRLRIDGQYAAVLWSCG